MAYAWSLAGLGMMVGFICGYKSVKTVKIGPVYPVNTTEIMVNGHMTRLKPNGYLELYRDGTYRKFYEKQT